VSENKCWAATLGGCGGPITIEHVVTKALFGKRVRVDGHTGGWLGTEADEISIKKLTANILCQDHNNELGRTADRSARRLLDCFRASQQPMKLRGSRILRPPVDRRLSGVEFGRWLCKTHCNLMIVNGMTPDAAYVCYAFQRPIPKPVFFFLACSLGDNLRLAYGRDPVVSWSQFVDDGQSRFDAFTISLAGFRTIVSTAPVQRNGKEMIDRIRVLEQQTALGPFRIIFDWSGEPPVI
jgi:hypothetical protein